MNGSPPKRIAWCSTIHTDTKRFPQSRAAYASEVLIPHLNSCGLFSVEVFHQGSGPSEYKGAKAFPYQRLRERHRENPYDLILYQVEDRPESQWLRIASCLLPGVTWFHDLYFSTHGPEPILNSAWQVTLDRFRDKNVPWATRGDEFEQIAPLGVREASFCLAPLFSNQRDASENAHHVHESLSKLLFQEEAPSYYLPLPVREELYRTSRVSTLKPRVAICGGARIEDRSHKVLQAVSQIEDIEIVWLVPKEEEMRANALLDEFEIAHVTLLPDLSPERWQEIVVESSVALHLRFSVFGQLEPYLGISLAQGLPTLVSRFGTCESMPKNIVFQIEPGVREANQIGAVIESVLSGKSPHSAECNVSYSEEIYHEKSIASQLIAVLDELSADPQYISASKQWREFESDASESLLTELSEGVVIEPNLEAALQKKFEEVKGEFGW